MNLIRKSATALLGLSLVTATAGAQSWTSVAAGSLNQAGGAGYWDQLSYDGSGCYIIFVLGGFRGFGQGWLPTDPEYIGVTDGTRITKFTGPASYTVTYASDFSLAMPGYLPREQVYSGGSFKTEPRFALFISYDRSSAAFSGVIATGLMGIGLVGRRRKA